MALGFKPSRSTKAGEIHATLLLGSSSGATYSTSFSDSESLLTWIIRLYWPGMMKLALAKTPRSRF
ncbi:hypothetical protein D3C77_339340 [compost metagenome]